MTRIGLISDTHGWLDEAVFEYFKTCDEIWHAGDFGNLTLGPSTKEEGKREFPIEDEKSYGDLILQKFFRLFGRKIIFRGVYGNIDTPRLRVIYPEKIFFLCEGVNIFMQHIGGYPGRYSKGVKEDIIAHKSGLFISGHSHILKIMYDQKFHCLHMNPGAAGKQGWHKMRTIVRFAIEGKEIKNCEVIELGERGKIN